MLADCEAIPKELSLIISWTTFGFGNFDFLPFLEGSVLVGIARSFVGLSFIVLPLKTGMFADLSAFSLSSSKSMQSTLSA